MMFRFNHYLFAAAAFWAAAAMFGTASAHEIDVEWVRNYYRPGRYTPTIQSIFKGEGGLIYALGNKSVATGEPGPFEPNQAWIGILRPPYESIDFSRNYGDSSHSAVAYCMATSDEQLVLIGTIEDSLDLDSRRCFALYLDRNTDSVDYIEFGNEAYERPSPRQMFVEPDGGLTTFVTYPTPDPWGMYRLDPDRRTIDGTYYQRGDANYPEGRFDLSYGKGAAVRYEEDYFVAGEMNIERRYGDITERGNAAAISRLNRDGAVVWTTMYLDSVLYRAPDRYIFSREGLMNCVLVHSSGGIYAVGSTDRRSGEPREALLFCKYDAEGNVLWERLHDDNYDIPQTNFQYMIELRPDLIALFGHMKYGTQNPMDNGVYVALIDSAGEWLGGTFVRDERLNSGATFSDVILLDSNRVFAQFQNHWNLFAMFRFDLDPVEESVDNRSDSQPEEFSLSAYPNPFNSSTTISFSLSSPLIDPLHPSSLAVFDLHGREVARLFDSPTLTPSNSLTWNSEGVPAGIYLLILESGLSVQTMKVVLLR